MIEIINEVLKSEAKVLIRNNEDLKEFTENGKNVKKSILDNRFEIIMELVDSIDKKDDSFYAELVKVLSSHITDLYDRKVKNFVITLVDENEDIDSKQFNSIDTFDLEKLNRELAGQIFNYLKDVLRDNKNLVLDVETLKNLLNRNPKLFSLSVETSYTYMPFDFKGLANILEANNTLGKSNISMDDIYQILYDTCQLNNVDVFCSLVQPEQFKQNHQRIDEILEKCNAKTFVEITNIIRRKLDKEFDRLSFVKKRKENNFCESVIMESLQWSPDEEDFAFVHAILTDADITLDYDLNFVDYFGETTLRDTIAIRGDKTLTEDLLSKKENIQNYYRHGESYIPIYNLYARIGDYEKVLELFQKSYVYSQDYTEDWDDDFNKLGYTYGDYAYKDSVASLISGMCNSLMRDNVEYPLAVSLINRVLSSECVKYINLEETLTPIQEMFKAEDYNKLVDDLLERHRAGKLGFLLVREGDGMFQRYIISVANEAIIKEQIDGLNKKYKNKGLVPPKKDDIES